MAPPSATLAAYRDTLTPGIDACLLDG